MPARSRPLACAAVVALSALLIGCHPRQQPAINTEVAGARTSLDTLGLSLVLPEGWTVETQNVNVSPDGEHALALAYVVGRHGQATTHHHLVISRCDDLGLIGRFSWSHGWDTATEDQQHWQLVADIPSGNARLPFADGAGFVYRAPFSTDTPGDPTGKFYVYYLVHGPHAYRISIGGTESDFARQRPLYQRILQSIRITA